MVYCIDLFLQNLQNGLHIGRTEDVLDIFNADVKFSKHQNLFQALNSCFIIESVSIVIFSSAFDQTHFLVLAQSASGNAINHVFLPNCPLQSS